MSEPMSYEELQRLINGEGEEVEPGYRTVKEWAEFYRKSDSQTLKVLRRAVASGLFEKKQFRIKAGQCLRSIPHYREVERDG